MTYRCMIVDDEPLAHQVIQNYLMRFKTISAPLSFYNAEDAKKHLDTNTIDLLFLDIQMPENTGDRFLETLDVRPVTIFTTAYRKYALDGYELGVIDYLLKPIAFERFTIAINKSLELLSIIQPADNYFIKIKSGTQSILLDYRNILFAKGLKDYTIIFTREKKYAALGRLKVYEERLPSNYFLRVHKSYIIARNLIRVFEKQKIIFQDFEVPVGRSYKQKIMELLNNSIE